MINANTPVQEIMSANVLVANTGNSFTQLCRLFFEMNIHHLPVVDENYRLVGILSANDVLKAFSFGLNSLERPDDSSLDARFSIYDLMTPNPVTVSPNTSIREAARICTTKHIQSLPVIENGKMTGIVTSRDIVRFMAKEQEMVK